MILIRFLLAICLFLASRSGMASDHSVVISKKIARQSGGNFIDSVQIHTRDWEDLVVSFAFTVEKQEDFRLVSADLKTSSKTLAMHPDCESNLEKFSFVSKLVFLTTDDFGWLKINLIPKKNSQTEIVVHYHVYGVQSVYPSLTKEHFRAERSCACPHPAYIPRAVWGQTFNLTDQIFRPPATYTDVTHLIVHHSATANQSNNWPAVVASIFNYHANTNQWQDIGYNWLIDPEGNLYQGRGGGEDVRGAHMCGYNNNTMGVCLLGTFSAADPDPRALETLNALLAYKVCQKNLDPLGSDSIQSHTGYMHHISGHKDGCAPNYTECPGNRLHAFLPFLRENCVAFIQDSCENFSGTELVINENQQEIVLLADGKVQIKNGVGRKGFVADISGKIIHFFNVESDDELKDFETLNAGFYIIGVINRQAVSLKKWIKT